MAELPLDQGIPRFKTNEDKFNLFVNGTSAQFYLTPENDEVPSLRKFLADKDAQINDAADGILAEAVAQAGSASSSAEAAAASAQAAQEAADAAGGFDPASYYQKTYIDDNFYTKNTSDARYYTQTYINGVLATVNANVNAAQTAVAASALLINNLNSSVSVLALEVADLKGGLVGMTGRIADSYDDTTGLQLQTGGLDANTLLLMHFDGANGSQVFTDSSLYNRSIVVGGGDPKMSNAESVFGGSSGWFDGTGDGLSMGWTSDFAFGAGDFTIDFRLKVVAHTRQYASVMDMTWAGTGSMLLQIQNGKLAFYIQNNGIDVTETTPLVLNTWYHYAIVRQNGVLTMYKDGVLQQSVANVENVTLTAGNSLSIGWAGGTESVLNGYIDEFRISNVARWSSAFTPPTAPYASTADGSQTLNAEYDAANDYFKPTLIDQSTKMLLHFDGANGSKVVTDAAKPARPVTVNGDAQLSTSRSKFGSASLVCDGTADYLAIADFSDFAVNTGDYTFEGCFYFNNYTVAPVLIGFNTAASQTAPYIYVSTTGKVVLYYNGAIILTCATTITLNAWHHIAWVRKNGVTTIYLDGVADGTLADTRNYTLNGCYIGANYAGAASLNGNIDEIRFSNVARYSANFVPPAAAFDTGVKRNNMTVVSKNFAAAASPSKGRLLIQVAEIVDTINPATDLVGDFSRDGGATWITPTISEILPPPGGNIRLFEAVGDFTGPAGTQLKYRSKILNNKNVALSGAILQVA
ncbi:LamG domain-containing protein [Rhizobium sp. S152]|uniref:LamG domain-containing protein n=1 Tax=Rhizobium sp. S152 TaxID=3055038 RepID=UPI0025A9F591|nr:LamG domain-containing protein [Rhizobium sp. S152]MDM9626294.1 LamG domain-containing protein [Rhizobium sp. S152]